MHDGGVTIPTTPVVPSPISSSCDFELRIRDYLKLEKFTVALEALQFDVRLAFDPRLWHHR